MAVTVTVNIYKEVLVTIQLYNSRTSTSKGYVVVYEEFLIHYYRSYNNTAKLASCCVL